MTAFHRIVLLLLIVVPQLVQAAPFPREKSETVIKQAVVRASSSVVRIETIGGMDVLDGQLANTGPTTGVIVSTDGYIITSSFNFATNPSSVLVTLPESNKRLPAEIIARDNLKMLTLLKVKAENLSPAVPSALKNIRVGQWSLALGRTYDSPLPNVSLGLISALGRIEGKALQCDAKVSPSNYGGPLVDIKGDVMGVLVPLSPSGKKLSEGVKWYDSGIGFAIPMEQIYASLDRLKAGKNLQAGLMGVSFGRTPPFLAESVIQEVRPNSPGATAGLKAKDRIISIEGIPVRTVANIKQRLGTKYAGDTVLLKVKRGDKTEELKITLAEKLEPFRHAWLGILGERLNLDEDAGVIIRHVMAGSPAQVAGLKAQDRLLSVDGQQIASFEELRELVFLKQPGVDVKIVYERSGAKSPELKVTTAAIPDSIPKELPLPVLLPGGQKPAIKAPETGELNKTLAEHDQKYRMYVPEDYRADADYGLMFWLSADGASIPKKEFAQWKRVCRTRGMILVMPVSKELKAWTSDDVSWLLECLKEVEENFNVDAKMTCLVTGGQDASFTWQLAFEHREIFEGLFSMGVPRRFRAPFNEPGYRMQVLVSVHDEKQKKVSIKLQSYLKREGFAITTMERGEKISVENFDILGRWLDMLSGI